MFKIKNDTFRGQYEIMQDGLPVFACPVDQFVDLSNAVVKYVVGKDYIISSPGRQETARGYGKYHFIKGFLLALCHDLKKKYVQKTDTTDKEA